MTVAILGGIDRLKQNYEKQGKNFGVNLRVFSQRVPNLPKRLGDVKGIVLFTGTISHPMVVEASQAAKKYGIPIERCHSSSISGLKRCLEQMEQKGRLS